MSKALCFSSMTQTIRSVVSAAKTTATASNNTASEIPPDVFLDKYNDERLRFKLFQPRRSTDRGNVVTIPRRLVES
jgi:hypothetical protein